jgi:hypothetical protein
MPDGDVTSFLAGDSVLGRDQRIESGPLEGKRVSLVAAGQYEIYDAPYPGRVDSFSVSLLPSGDQLWTETYLEPLEFASLPSDGKSIERILARVDLYAKEGVDFSGNVHTNIFSGLGGDDILSGNGGNDRLKGAAGIDTLLGGAGNDVLDGGNSGDTLDCGSGNDTLSGGTGADSLRGGTGKDRFEFKATTESSGSAFDKIRDFVSGQDIVVLSDIDARMDRSGDQDFAFKAGGLTHKAGQLTFDGGRILGDTDGNGAPDLIMEVASAVTLVSDDFVL